MLIFNNSKLFPIGKCLGLSFNQVLIPFTQKCFRLTLKLSKAKIDGRRTKGDQKGSFELSAQMN